MYLCIEIICSVQGVLNWEGDGSSTKDVHASLHHSTIVIIEDETDASNVPASEGSTDGVGVDDVVPDPGGEVLNETGGGGLNHKGSHEDGSGDGLLLIFVHL